ncbi:MAG: SOS response-associated peptidase [Anaerolineales bacterium]
MCGRFTLTADPAELQEAFPQFSFPNEGRPRFNIAPSQPVLVLPNDGTPTLAGGARGNRADYFLWGLIPSWSKDPTMGARLINARAETLGEKPSFRGSYKYHRCLVFADGFYEWKPEPGTKAKTPHFIRLTSGLPFAFAGLWDEWHSPDGSQIKSCTIITTAPNELMSKLHDRMPVILPPDAFAQWLDPAPRPPSALQNLLVPYPSAAMTAYPVSTLVNSPANDRAECVVPA